MSGASHLARMVRWPVGVRTVLFVYGDATTEQPLNILEGHTSDVWSVAFSGDGSTLASGSADGTIMLWDATTKQPLNTLEGHTDDVRSVALSPEGSILASGSLDRTIRLWDVATGQLKQDT